MTPREYGQLLAKSAPPLTDDQVEQAARMFAAIAADVTDVAA